MAAIEVESSWSGTEQEGKLCPLCAGPLREPAVRNSMSRIATGTYVCNTCGMREALLSARPAPNRVCLYVDDVSADVMLVTENEADYTPFVTNRVQHRWVTEYVDAANAALGLTRRDVQRIVGSSISR